MRNHLLCATAAAMALRCGGDPAGPGVPACSLDAGWRSGVYSYVAARDGRQLLAGLIRLDIEDSLITGSWDIDWAPDADTTVAVGPQLGSGTLIGIKRNEQVTISLNPGVIGNNVTLEGSIYRYCLTGQWSWTRLGPPEAAGAFAGHSLARLFP
jgi:hypothetical protein